MPNAFNWDARKQFFNENARKTLTSLLICEHQIISLFYTEKISMYAGKQTDLFYLGNAISLMILRNLLA